MAVQTQGGGTLPKDNQNTSIQVASNIVTQDAEGTPNVSPIAAQSTTPEELVIPTNAVVLVINTVGQILRVGDNSTLDGTVGDGYFNIADGGTRTIPCADGNSIWIRSDTSTTVVSFYFESINT